MNSVVIGVGVLCFLAGISCGALWKVGRSDRDDAVIAPAPKRKGKL